MLFEEKIRDTTDIAIAVSPDDLSMAAASSQTELQPLHTPVVNAPRGLTLDVNDPFYNPALDLKDEKSILVSRLRSVNFNSNAADDTHVSADSKLIADEAENNSTAILLKRFQDRISNTQRNRRILISTAVFLWVLIVPAFVLSSIFSIKANDDENGSVESQSFTDALFQTVSTPELNTTCGHWFNSTGLFLYNVTTLACSYLQNVFLLNTTTFNMTVPDACHHFIDDYYDTSCTNPFFRTLSLALYAAGVICIGLGLLTCVLIASKDWMSRQTKNELHAAAVEFGIADEETNSLAISDATINQLADIPKTKSNIAACFKNCGPTKLNDATRNNLANHVLSYLFVPKKQFTQSHVFECFAPLYSESLDERATANKITEEVNQFLFPSINNSSAADQNRATESAPRNHT